MSTDQNKASVRQFFDEVCNKEKREIIGEIFADNVSFNGKPGSHDDVKNYLKEIENSFDKPHVEVKEQLAEGDMVSTRRVWIGTQKKEYHKQPSTGKPMTWTEISVVRFENGKIVEDWMVQSELQEVTPVDLMKSKEKYYRRLEFEHQLINNRITWLLTSQSLLFTAYALATKEEGKGDSFFLKTMASVGPMIAFLVAITIIASYLAKYKARKTYQNESGDMLEPLGVRTWVTNLGLVGEISLPVVFIIAWATILFKK